MYSGIGNKWHDIAVISLIWHMTIFGLYDGPDSVMEAVQKYPHSRLAACSPDRLLHSPDLHRLHLCYDSISSEVRDGRIVYQPVVLDSFIRLRPSPGGHKWIDLCMMTGFRSFVIVNTNCLHSYTTPITVVFPHASLSSMQIAYIRQTRHRVLG